MTSATAEVSPSIAPSPAPARKRRVPLWDNARFLCVALVVIGHSVQRLTGQSDHALMVYVFIYAFHMPAFAIISGYFSKASPPGSRQMRKVITDILLPYAIMQTIWTVVQYLAEGSTSLNPTTPHWTLWFLLALAVFRLVLPYLVLLRFPLLWSIVFSVGVGYLSNVDSTFSLSRAIGILPFFVLGWQVRQWKLAEKWRMLDRQALWVRLIAAAVLITWALSVVFFIGFWKEISVHWFFYDDSYDGLGQDAWWAGFVRLAFLALAAILSAAFFVLVPRSQSWITGFGQATMYIYLLHSFVLYPLRETGVLKGEHPSDWLLAAVILAAIAISIALASPIIRTVFRPLIEPKPRWLFIELDDKPGRGSRTDPTGARRPQR
ncbi:acyltransferase family protein [Lacisediminihabitans changchengi]|uniref:Acyltransferase family protein n=1 Tax=Lacisediminihabitans changchengi TaxID=2787634 RepID=A0A934SM16_9MICO|nr:acyltransferase family protein [Lacisediminihabitans changchengi]MBK4347442.1 acyltransferase family protein [Lacisediminihabitans changchengi]